MSSFFMTSRWPKRRGNKCNIVDVEITEHDWRGFRIINRRWKTAWDGYGMLFFIQRQCYIKSHNCFVSPPFVQQSPPASEQSTEGEMMPGDRVAQTTFSAVLQPLFNKIASTWFWSANRVNERNRQLCLLSGLRCEIHQPRCIALCWPTFKSYGGILWIPSFSTTVINRVNSDIYNSVYATVWDVI